MAEVHDEYLMSQAWPSYRPELTTFQMLTGVQIHRLYEKKRAEAQAAQARGMFGG